MACDFDLCVDCDILFFLNGLSRIRFDTPVWRADARLFVCFCLISSALALEFAYFLEFLIMGKIAHSRCFNLGDFS